MKLGLGITKQHISLQDRHCFYINFDGRTFYLFFPFISQDTKRLSYAYRYIKSDCISTVTGSINPYYDLKSKIIWFIQRSILIFKDEMYKQCEGCGEGVSTWKIKYLDFKEIEILINCCNKCVSFYDIQLSRRKIKEWKHEEVILHKEGVW